LFVVKLTEWRKHVWNKLAASLDVLDASESNFYPYAYYFDVYLHTVKTGQRFYASFVRMKKPEHYII